MYLKQWQLELWALLGCFGILVGIAVLLAVFDGESVSEWNGVTLNTVISVLAVSMKGFLVFSVAECIGQWKWIVFTRQKRKVMEFEMIDLASRGPVGAASLVWRRETPLTLRIGVLVIILTVALDPFSQQLIKFRQGIRYVQDFNGTQATSARTQDYTLGEVGVANTTNSTIDPGGRAERIMTAKLDTSMQASILSALSRSTSSIQQQADLRCATGNCTWPEFQTLGVCHRCNDLAAQLKQVNNFGDIWNLERGDGEDPYLKENVTALALPNGHYIANLNGCGAADTSLSYGCDYGSRKGTIMTAWGYKMTSFGTGNPNRTNSMQDIDTLIWSSSIIATSTEYISANEDRITTENFYGEYDWDALGTDDYDYAAANPNQYWPTSPVTAVECALYYCVKAISSSVDGNVIREDTKEVTEAMRDPESWVPRIDPDSYGYAPENIPDDIGTLYSLEYHDRYSAIDMDDLKLHFPDNASQEAYSMTQSAVKSISAFFQDFLSAPNVMNSTLREAISETLDVEDPVTYNGMARNFAKVPSAIGSIWSEPKSDIFDTFKRLAISMTNDMRANGGTESMLDLQGGRFTLDSPSDPVYGSVGTPTTFYRSEWYWIILHGILTLSGSAFCIVTIVKSADKARYVPSWKTSTLAVMNSGYESGNALKSTNTLHEMERTAKKTEMIVVLRGNENEVAEVSRVSGGSIDSSRDNTG